MTDPKTLTHPRIGAVRVSRALVGTLGVAVLAAGVFSAWPLGTLTTTTEPEEPTHPQRQQPPVTALEQDGFRAPIWVADPPPPSAKPPPAPTPPLRLQLLAITSDGSGLKAALYDPDTDKVLVVVSGDPIGHRSVERIAADAVVLREGEILRTLAINGSSP